MKEFKPAKNGLFSPEEFPPDPIRIGDAAYSGRIDAWGQQSDSYILGYIDAVYTMLLREGDSSANAWLHMATKNAVNASFQRNLERGELEGMMGDD